MSPRPRPRRPGSQVTALTRGLPWGPARSAAPPPRAWAVPSFEVMQTRGSAARSSLVAMPACPQGTAPAQPSHAERYRTPASAGPGPWHVCPPPRIRPPFPPDAPPKPQASVPFPARPGWCQEAVGRQTQAPAAPPPQPGKGGILLSDHLSPSPCCLGPASGLSDPSGPHLLLEGSTTAPSLFLQKPSDGAGRLEARLAPDGAAHPQGSRRPPPVVSRRPSRRSAAQRAS